MFLFSRSGTSRFLNTHVQKMRLLPRNFADAELTQKTR
jgi:hypothetical protein